MTYRHLLLAACASTGLLVAVGSLAMPVDILKTKAASTIDLAGYQVSDHDDDLGRKASDARGGDDDNGTCGGSGAATQQHNATPPVNGLFVPGSKPQAQTN